MCPAHISKVEDAGDPAILFPVEMLKTYCQNTLFLLYI